MSKSEPLITVGAIGSVVGALIILLRSFGAPVTDDQQNAILGFIAVAAPLIVALVGRQFVFAPQTTKDIADEQYIAGTKGKEQPKVSPPPGA